MHDPKIVAFEIYLGKKQKKNGHYRTPLITIWHNDPETDGTDDSCGWFMRSRHGNPEMLNKIKSAIDFDFDRVFKSDSATYYVGYFSPRSGNPNLSTMGIALCMFSTASWEFFNHNRRKQSKWMKENLYEILHFAENPVDSLKDDILGTFRIFTGAMAFANYMWTIFFIIPVVYYTLYRIDNKCGMRILLYLISIFNICTTSMIFTCTFNIPLQERQDMLISAFVFGFVTFLLIAVAVIANMLERVFLSGRDTNDPEVGLVESG